jgi:ADP-ribosylglycohydrolase
MRSSARPPIADPRTRIRAVLAGAAVGDVLGATWEFSPPSAIPSERRLTVQGGGPFGWPPGAFTDDTDLLLVTASAYGGARAPGAWSEAAFVDGLLAWFRSGPRDVGAQTARACRHWLSHAAPPPPDEAAQGNGGLMRAAPHGLAHPDAGKACAAAEADTRLTHPSALAAACSGLYAAVLSNLVWRGETDWRAALPALPATPAHDRLRRALAGLAPAPAPPQDPGGWCLHTLRLALWALDSGLGYEAGVQAVIRTGGDTDTNACVAGALLGARWGLQAIPQDWLGAVTGEGRRRLAAAAARLAAAAADQQKKRSSTTLPSCTV